MRLLLILCAVAISRAEQSPAERLIEAGHWKRARTFVEARLREAPGDALSNFLLSQIRGAFGDRTSTPLALAEKAVALDGRTAKYHRQVAEVLGVTACRRLPAIVYGPPVPQGDRRRTVLGSARSPGAARSAGVQSARPGYRRWGSAQGGRTGWPDRGDRCRRRAAGASAHRRIP